MDLGTMVRELGTGMLITTEIFVLTLVFSLPLGMVLAFGRMARLKVLSFLTKLYISIMRGTPLMLQLIVVYFCLLYTSHPSRWAVLPVSSQVCYRPPVPCLLYTSKRFCPVGS